MHHLIMYLIEEKKKKHFGKVKAEQVFQNNVVNLPSPSLPRKDSVGVGYWPVFESH